MPVIDLGAYWDLIGSYINAPVGGSEITVGMLLAFFLILYLIAKLSQRK